MNFKQVAVKAAKEAGKIQLKYYEKDIKKKRKENDSFVTIADIECTKIIRKILLKAFPDHDLLDEELGHMKKKSDYKWIVDPIDGTHNYMMKNPLFGVSIALEHKKEIILGVIFMPILKKLYIAEKGKGAFCNGKNIKVNKETKLSRCLMIFEARMRTNTKKKMNVLRKLVGLTWRLRIYGVAVYHNLLIANGEAGLNIDFNSNPWDHAAALLIVEEAGGKVTDFKGKRWTPYIKDYLASNGKVHDKILKIINRS